MGISQTKTTGHAQNNFKRNLQIVKILQSPHVIRVSNMEVDAQLSKVVVNCLHSNSTRVIDLQNCRMVDKDIMRIIGAIISNQSLREIYIHNISGISEETRLILANFRICGKRSRSEN
jgi:hypothetical protein